MHRRNASFVGAIAALVAVGAFVGWRILFPSNPTRGDARVMAEYIDAQRADVIHTYNRRPGFDVSDPSYEIYLSLAGRIDTTAASLVAHLEEQGYVTESRPFIYDEQCAVGVWAHPYCSEQGYDEEWLGASENGGRPYLLLHASKGKSVIEAEIVDRDFRAHSNDDFMGDHTVEEGSVVISITFRHA